MNHPFRVGGVYRNRQGEYEVISINEPQMTIRCKDGREFTGAIATLARIWENVQLPETGQPRLDDEGSVRNAPRNTRTKRAGIRFAGLQDADFKEGITGTSWRARDQLGGLLALRLTDELGVAFNSWPIYRQARVYITLDEFAIGTRELGVRVVKFYFSLGERGARCGLYIEHNDGPMDEAWDWPRFVKKIRSGAGQEAVLAAMRGFGVVAELWLTPRNAAGVCVGRLSALQDRLMWQESDDRVARQISWSQFGERLALIEDDVWADLVLFAGIEKEEAIRLGLGVADRAAAIFGALYPLYRLSLK